jgi:orotidine-5'-phosphate decarboxylase
VEPFGVRLRSAVAARGPLCIGIDPHPGLLRDWGVGDDAAGLERFARTAVDALADRVAVLKPQSAFFERFGSQGIATLERVLADARAAGALVLLDVKRGDIGSTMAAYADAYLDPASPLAADAVTASPYLGFGALHPLLSAARAAGAGVFVLALTSNPEGAEVQRATGRDGRTVAQRILDAVAEQNATELAASPAAARVGLGSVGVVVGATVGHVGRPGAGDGTARAGGGGQARSSHGHDLSGLRGPVLAPGVGAQGATLADLPTVFGAVLPDVLPSVSREVLRHGPDRTRLRAITDRLREEAATLVSAVGAAAYGSVT